MFDKTAFIFWVAGTICILLSPPVCAWFVTVVTVETATVPVAVTVPDTGTVFRTETLRSFATPRTALSVLTCCTASNIDDSHSITFFCGVYAICLYYIMS